MPVHTFTLFVETDDNDERSDPSDWTSVIVSALFAAGATGVHFDTRTDFNFSVKDPDSETTYTPWTDGQAVGFRCERNGEVEYIYLQPSDGSDDGVATVFPYQGPTGEAGQDDVAGGEHYVILDNGPAE